MFRCSFLSYDGGSNQSSVLVNIANALAIQGQNAVIIDLEFETQQLPSFSSTEQPDAMFQPAQLFKVKEQVVDDLNLIKNSESSNNIILEGWLNSITKPPPEDNNSLLERLKKIPVYEVKSIHRHALEGRLFFCSSRRQV